MTGEEKDLDRLRHMLDAAREAVGILGDAGVPELRADRVRALAVVKCIEIVGEAASKTAQATRDRHPSIPWRQAIGMRDRLIHGYMDIDYETVQRTVRHDLPSVIATLSGIMGRE